METKKPISMQQGKSDNFQTPKDTLDPLLPYLKKEWRIWECAKGEGNLTQGLRSLGFNVLGTDINDEEVDFDYEGVSEEEMNDVNTKYLGNPLLHDFLLWEPPTGFDCIITNPPFSLKQEFLERCYKLGRPFALLLPLTTFETYKRQKLFQKYGLQIILFDKRINFKTPSGGGFWFLVCYCLVYLGIKFTQRNKFLQVERGN